MCLTHLGLSDVDRGAPEHPLRTAGVLTKQRVCHRNEAETREKSSRSRPGREMLRPTWRDFAPAGDLSPIRGAAQIGSRQARAVGQARLSVPEAHIADRTSSCARGRQSVSWRWNSPAATSINELA